MMVPAQQATDFRTLIYRLDTILLRLDRRGAASCIDLDKTPRTIRLDSL